MKNFLDKKLNLCYSNLFFIFGAIMPVVRVDKRVYVALQSMAELERGTLNSVIEELLIKTGKLKPQQTTIGKAKELEDKMEQFLKSERRFESQRAAMKKMFLKFKGNEEETIHAYAYLEENNLVSRKRDSHHWKPLTYARALFNDGIRKGWLH